MAVIHEEQIFVNVYQAESAPHHFCRVAPYIQEWQSGKHLNHESRKALEHSSYAAFEALYHAQETMASKLLAATKNTLETQKLVNIRERIITLADALEEYMFDSTKTYTAEEISMKKKQARALASEYVHRNPNSEIASIDEETYKRLLLSQVEQ